jgi:excisionase family DNA binding protein
MTNEIIERLTNIERMLKEQAAKPLTFEEACTYLNVSKSHLYKLTSSGMIPHYKPNGKMVYFSKPELDEWIMKNPVKTRSQISEMSDEYMLNNNRQAIR